MLVSFQALRDWPLAGIGGGGDDSAAAAPALPARVGGRLGSSRAAAGADGRARRGQTDPHGRHGPRRRDGKASKRRADAAADTGAGVAHRGSPTAPRPAVGRRRRASAARRSEHRPARPPRAAESVLRCNAPAGPRAPMTAGRRDRRDRHARQQNSGTLKPASQSGPPARSEGSLAVLPANVAKRAEMQSGDCAAADRALVAPRLRAVLNSPGGRPGSPTIPPRSPTVTMPAYGGAWTGRCGG